MCDSKGLLVIISGPSGSGKGTICKELLIKNVDLHLSVSATTRLPRTGEVEGVNYYFRTKEVFEDMIKKDEFLEYAEVFGNYYGTPKQKVAEVIDSYKDCILEIEVQGAFQVMKNSIDYISIFIVPPSMSELEARLRGRATESEDSILERLKRSELELKLLDKYDYVVINNTIEQAVKDIESIISAERCRIKRINIEKLIGGILL